MVPRLGNMDHILIAGDIAFSGKRAEYEEATEWLEQVASICGCKRTDVLTVPGNHDVDRHRILPATKMIHKRLRTSSLPEAKHELVALAAQNDGSLTDKLSDYQAFASAFGCHFESPSRPHWNRLIPLGHDLMLRFVGLTTVQVCDAEDQKGALLLGTNQYVLERSPRVEVIVILHHPAEWIKDRQEAFQYLDSRARVQVFGHEHFQDIHQITNASQDARLVICSGAVTPENAAAPYIYRYNILEFAVGPDSCLQITIHPRVWIPDDTRFNADTAPLGGRESTTFTIPCPQFKLPAAPVAAVDLVARSAHDGPVVAAEDDDAFAKVSYFFWRYLSWQNQLKVLVETEVLPVTSAAPALQTIVRMGLEQARGQNKLGQLWDRIMTFVPVPKREPNPFIQPEQLREPC